MHTQQVFLDGMQNPGEWVEAQCRELGISVVEVAREARVNRSTIFRWKKGHNSPYWDNVRRIRHVLDLRRRMIAKDGA